MPTGPRWCTWGRGGPGQPTQLWIRRWADLSATRIRGTDGAVTFALSPDGREVAFAQAPGALRIVPLDGGPVRTLLPAVMTVSLWAPDGTLFFTGRSPFALNRIPLKGGEARTVTELLEGETCHGFLSLLPGGSMAVFQVGVGAGSKLWAVDLDSGERRPLTAGTSPQYTSTGHLLFPALDAGGDILVWDKASQLLKRDGK